jgi:macrodomain Ter protein organizer (MatP/YcbG family)
MLTRGHYLKRFSRTARRKGRRPKSLRVSVRGEAYLKLRKYAEKRKLSLSRAVNYLILEAQ